MYNWIKYFKSLGIDYEEELKLMQKEIYTGLQIPQEYFGNNHPMQQYFKSLKEFTKREQEKNIEDQKIFDALETTCTVNEQQLKNTKEILHKNNKPVSSEFKLYDCVKKDYEEMQDEAAFKALDYAGANLMIESMKYLDDSQAELASDIINEKLNLQLSDIKLRQLTNILTDLFINQTHSVDGEFGTFNRDTFLTSSKHFNKIDIKYGAKVYFNGFFLETIDYNKYEIGFDTEYGEYVTRKPDEEVAWQIISEHINLLKNESGCQNLLLSEISSEEKKNSIIKSTLNFLIKNKEIKTLQEIKSKIKYLSQFGFDFYIKPGLVYICSDPEFVGKIPKTNYNLTLHTMNNLPAYATVSTDLMVSDLKKITSLKDSIEKINNSLQHKHATCSKCRNINEYLNFDPNYVCYNCR